MSTDHPPSVSRSRTLSIREAAAQAGVTDKTVRRWIKAGRLSALKVGNQYEIDPEHLAQAMADSAVDIRLDTGQFERVDTPHDGVDIAPARVDIPHVQTVDIAPLADIIERQGEQIRALTEAATGWQFRAMRAEEQLKQLTAGSAPETPQMPQDAPDGAERAPDTSQSERPAWWRRWLGLNSGAL